MNPIWKFIPADLAHSLAPLGVRLYADLFGQEISRCAWHPLLWKGLTFPNRLGIAGGVDKNADCLDSWPRLGFGFVEIGTVTPKPQLANPGKILDRDWEQKNLWNKMGFPNDGAHALMARFATNTKPPTPLFINIGKNRETANEKAVEDYVHLAEKFKNYADVFVINISSPNTKNLRELQDKKFLVELIEQVTSAAVEVPILVKVSPDLNEKNLQSVLENASSAGASGFILTNTTAKRPNLESANQKLNKTSGWPAEGGISGAFLAEHSQQALRIAEKHFRGAHPNKPLLISVGGVLTPDDVAHRLDLGADLVQSYSALVFSGPGFGLKVSKAVQEKRNE